MFSCHALHGPDGWHGGGKERKEKEKKKKKREADPIVEVEGVEGAAFTFMCQYMKLKFSI